MGIFNTLLGTHQSQYNQNATKTKTKDSAVKALLIIYAVCQKKKGVNVLHSNSNTFPKGHITYTSNRSCGESLKQVS
jgi:hypothetical protein